MQRHRKTNLLDLINKRSQARQKAFGANQTWLNGEETEQVLSQLPANEQKIVHSFLNQLAEKERIKTPESGHKFFDPMAGP